MPGKWVAKKLLRILDAALVAALLITPVVARAETNAVAACCAKSAETVGRPSDKSLFQLESRWTTDSSRQISLAALRGRPQVLVMFFASCQYACPLLVNDLKQIEAALPAAARARVGFTLVTFDPRRDTPAALAKYRASRDLSASTWTLLRGESDDILELAALLGVQFKQDANGQFAHSNVVTLLNDEGEIAYQRAGLNLPPEDIVKRLMAMLHPVK